MPGGVGFGLSGGSADWCRNSRFHQSDDQASRQYSTISVAADQLAACGHRSAVTDDVRRKFAFLRAEGFPLDNPHLKYLIIGWGSKRFYTSTKDYADIEFETTWTAVTGDQSVMHVQVAGELKEQPDVIELAVSEWHFNKLLTFIDESFHRKEGSVQVIPNKGFGLGDRFFEGVGGFNIFHPCNLWISRGLREAGYVTGIWTPTTYSLKLAHWLHN